MGAVVAAGCLLSQLPLQDLDHSVLLLQLFGQPARGVQAEKDEEEEEDLAQFDKNKGSRCGSLLLPVQLF